MLVVKERKYSNNFGIMICGLAIVLSAFQVSLAQQGGLDTSWGINNTGIYQDPWPSITDPTNIARRFGPIEVLADGRITVAGNGTKNLGSGNFVNDLVVGRLKADGSADTTFAGGVGSLETTFLTFNGIETNVLGTVMGVQPSDGKIVIAAQCVVNFAPNPNDNQLGSDLCLWRFNTDGTLDTTFGGNTVTAWGGNGNFPPTTYTIPPGKVWTYTGKIVFFPTITGGGFNGSPVRIRFTTDNKIVVFGNSMDLVAPDGGLRRFKGFIAVYSTNGTLQSITDLIDTTGNTTDGFGTTKINDGDILSTGDFFSVGSQSRLVSSNPAVFTHSKWIVFRNASGQFLDQVNNNLPEGAFGFAQLRSNKILVSGVAGAAQPQFVRYNGDLTIDSTFGTGGRLIPTCNGNFCYDTQAIAGMSAQNDGRVIGITYNGNLFRLNADGSPDRSFGDASSLGSRGILPNGKYTTPFATRPGSDARIFFSSFDQRPNGRMVVSGVTGNHPGGFDYQAVALQLKTYLRNGGVFDDFNNDGKAEISVFRPSAGAWYRSDSFSGGISGLQWGVSTDRIAPADYDGDGKTDVAVFRDGVWYIQQSSNGQIRYENWGVSGDLPMPGDFNGDGIADIAVFRPLDGNWYIHYSNPIQPGNVNFVSFHFGQNGDAPIIADFDGDGKTDITIFRSGDWYQLLSATNNSFLYTHFGVAGDVPVAADYDGDGKADIAVFRSGTWYVQKSTSVRGIISQNWGLTGDKPVPGDYDNDGRSDFAVFRQGTWWILRSSDNSFSGTQFGFASDIPIPAAYLP